MFIVSKDKSYVLLTAFQALQHFAMESIEEHYNGWKPVI